MINPKLAEQGYAANCKKYNGNIYVVSQQTYKAGIDPVTGTNSARVIEHKSTLYINGFCFEYSIIFGRVIFL